MPLFPDEFPFNKPRQAPAPIATPTPVATPAPTPAVTAPIAPPPVVSAPVSKPRVAPAPTPTIAPAPSPTQLPADEERRQSPRQALAARALVRNETANGPGWKVELLNISMLGIRFISANRLSPGDKASIKLECGPLRWATKLRVVHCQKLKDGSHAIGCEFVANELSRPARHAA